MRQTIFLFNQRFKYNMISIVDRDRTIAVLVPTKPSAVTLLMLITKLVYMLVLTLVASMEK